MKAPSYHFQSLSLTDIVTPGAARTIARSIALDQSQNMAAQNRPETTACENLARKTWGLYAAGDYGEAKTGQFSLATKTYRRSLEIDAKSAQALINLDVAELKSGRFQDTIKPFETAPQIDSSNRQAQTPPAMSQWNLRQFEAAARNLEALFKGERANMLHQYLANPISARINNSASKRSSRN